MPEDENPIEETTKTAGEIANDTTTALASRVETLEGTVVNMANEIAALKPVAAAETATAGVNETLEPTVESAPAPEAVHSENETGRSPLRTFHDLLG